MSQDVPASAGQPELFCFERWPFSLRELREPGTHAYLWGEFPPGPYVAIVGSREASEVGNAAARRLARELAAEGVTIVSGGAVGIDASAHRGALDAGGRTLVVGPVWLDRAYPEENRPLFAEILKRGGAYCCVSGEETKAHYPSFFRRNEALVALCQLLIVGESGFRSGARNAFAHAHRLGRPSYVLPSPYGHERGTGSNALLDQGARIALSPQLLVRRLEQLGSYDNPVWWRSTMRRQESLRLWARAQASSAPSETWARPYFGSLPASDGSFEPTGADAPSAVDVSEEYGPAEDVSEADGPTEADEATGAEVPAGADGAVTEGAVAEGAAAVGSTEQLVLEAIESGARQVDAVVARTGLGVGLVQYQLMLLTLAGRVREDERGLLAVLSAPLSAPLSARLSARQGGRPSAPRRRKS